VAITEVFSKTGEAEEVGSAVADSGGESAAEVAMVGSDVE